jgi:DNA-binding Xre family transcriptional regulator
MTFARHSADEALPAPEGQARAGRQARFLQSLKYPLYQEMAAQGLTVTKLAERLGVTKGAVSRALNPDNNIEALTLFSIAEALGCEWQVALRRSPNTAKG